MCSVRPELLCPAREGSRCGALSWQRSEGKRDPAGAGAGRQNRSLRGALSAGGRGRSGWRPLSPGFVPAEPSAGGGEGGKSEGQMAQIIAS